MENLEDMVDGTLAAICKGITQAREQGLPCALPDYVDFELPAFNQPYDFGLKFRVHIAADGAGSAEPRT